MRRPRLYLPLLFPLLLFGTVGAQKGELYRNDGGRFTDVSRKVART